ELAKRKVEEKPSETITVIAKPALPERPKLPTVTEQEPAAPTTVEEPMQSSALDPGALEAGGGTNQYVVPQDISGGELPKSPTVPFTYASDVGSLGLVVTQPAAANGSFFQVGRRYSYTLGDVERSFVCIGLYVSSTEAEESHSELSENAGRWY